MHHSRSLTPGADIVIDDLPALRLSPEGLRALSVFSGPRVAVVGRIGPRCRDCRDFVRAVTSTGVAVCGNAVHGEGPDTAVRAEDKPQLPLRPIPHEKDGRQDSPQEPARPHPRSTLLVG